MDVGHWTAQGHTLDELPGVGLRVSYSQFGEDLAILAQLESLGLMRDGYFVDVGAFHPWQYSNTALLYLGFGWRGLNVEARQEAVDLFRAERPLDVSVRALVGDDDRVRVFRSFNHPAVSTADDEMARIQGSANTPFEVVSEEELPTRRLSDIMAEHVPADQQVRLLSVDVEGMDLDVLRSYPWERHRPLLVAAEMHGGGLEHAANNPVCAFLLQRGYSLESITRVTGIFQDVRARA